MELFDWNIAAGSNNSTPPNGWPEFMEYSAVNNVGRENMAVLARFYRAALSGINVTAGTQPAYTLTSGQTFSAYSTGQMFAFTAHATAAGGPVTLNVDGKGAIGIVDALGTALGAGDIVAGGVYLVVKTSTTFRLIGGFAFASFSGAFQPADAELAAIAALTSAADKGIQFTGSGTAATFDLTLAGRSIVAAATVAAAFEVIKQAASETLAGVLELATDAEIRASSAGGLALTAADLETAAAPVALTDAATVAVDWASGINFTVTLAGNRTLGNPTNGKPGQWRRVQITQDATGSRTLAYGGQYLHPGSTEPVLSTAANAVDTLYIYCRTTSLFEVHVGGKAWAA
jgi:hypothetical protein